MQKAIGSDIMMVLDHCIPSTAPHAEAEARCNSRIAGPSARCAREATLRRRSLVSCKARVITICGEQSAAFLSELPFDGLAIGGLAVGETHAERYEFTGHGDGRAARRICRAI